MKCKNCGIYVEKGSNICFHCGSPIEQPKKSTKIFKMIIPYILILAILIFFEYINYQKKVISSNKEILQFLKEKDEINTIKNNQKDFLFEGRSIEIKEGYRVESQKTLSNEKYVIEFYKYHNQSIKDLILIKDQLYSLYFKDNLILANISLKKLNEVEFIYSETQFSSKKLLMLFFNIENNKSAAIAIFSKDASLPDGEAINDIIEMLKTIK